MNRVALIALACWFASGLLNLVLSRWSPEQIGAAAEKTHWGHELAALLRKAGFDLPGVVAIVVRLARRWLAARAAAPQ